MLPQLNMILQKHYLRMIVFHHVIDKLFFLWNGQMNMETKRKWNIYIDHNMLNMQINRSQRYSMLKMIFIHVDLFDFDRKNKQECSVLLYRFSTIYFLVVFHIFSFAIYL
jgi:hypothetical protein